MDDFNNTNRVADPEVLRSAVLSKQHGLKPDAPHERLTAKTFAANYGILEWAQRGDLAKAVQAFDTGGLFNPHSNVFVSREFYLMRIYDAAEALGQKQFEQFVPGIWDELLAVYRMTFSVKLRSKRVTLESSAPVDPEQLYSDQQE